MMDKRHKDLLRKHRLWLSEQLVSDTIVQFLYQEDILTQTQVEIIECQPCTKHRVLKLLDILPSRGPQAFDVFLQSLEEFPWIQDKLQKDQASTAHSSTDVVYLSDHILRKVPTDRELSRVASLLGEQWETVLLDLELTAEDLYRCRVDHRSDVHGAALEGLVHWRQAQGKRATVQRLVQSLEVVDIHPSMLLDTFQ